jgi:hypothetical protein
MLTDQKRSFDSAKAQIISALELAVADLTRRVQRNYNFRFVGEQEGRRFRLAMHDWINGGSAGPSPQATTRRELRETIYSLAESAKQLTAFPRVCSVASIELAESALGGLNAGRVIVPFSALRGLIERIAVAATLAGSLKTFGQSSTPLKSPLDPVIDAGHAAYKSLYATRRDWVKLGQADFRTTSPSDVPYLKQTAQADAKASGIMKAIDKLEQRVPGARLVYEVLCEFAHPNVGDLFGTTVAFHIFTDSEGSRHYARTIGLGSKDECGHEAQQEIAQKLFDVGSDIVRQLPLVLNEIETVSVKATNITRQFSHQALKTNRGLFSSRDPCPCLSGYTVKDCTRRRPAGRR